MNVTMLSFKRHHVLYAFVFCAKLRRYDLLIPMNDRRRAYAKTLCAYDWFVLRPRQNVVINRKMNTSSSKVMLITIKIIANSEKELRHDQ